VASYEAQINVILNGQRSIDTLASSLGEVQTAIDQIERRWRSATQLIQRSQIRLNAIGTEPPRGQGGRFARDPNRQARFEAYAVQRRARQEEFLSRRSIARGRSEEAIIGNQITGQREAIRLAERRAEIESRQNSASILFERQLQAFRRGGGGTRLDPQLQDRAREAQAAYTAIGGAASRNRGLVSALATEMGRVVQAQNEMNRGGSVRSKAFETSRSAFERISALQEQGTVSRSRIARARRLAAPISEAANAGDQFGSSEAARRASAFISRLERESRSLQNRTKKTIKNATSSPVRGGVNFPGSPLALQESRRATERAMAQGVKNAISSPVRGGASFPGSPIALQESRRATQQAMAQSAKNAISSPIRGGTNFPGSPTALKETEKAIERAMAQGIKNAVSSPIRGGANFPGSPIAIEEARRQGIKNALSSPVRGGLNFPGSPIAVEAAMKGQRAGYPSSPIGGSVNMPGSPIFNQTPFLERKFGRKGGAAISEGLIGGAFPLLFGQGLGASVGGGLGGAVGGFAGGGLGFGLSLIGTALGSALDGVATAAKDAASSLRDPITNFQKLADAGLFASKSQEQQIKNLIEYGNSAKATSIIQEELARKIGALGMRDMANLDEQSVRLGKAWAELNLQIQAAIAGPLAGLLEWTANIIELFNGGNKREAQRKDFIESLTPAGKIEYNRRRALNVYGATGESEAALRNSLKGQTTPLKQPALKIDPAKQQEEADKLLQDNRTKEDQLLQRKRETEDIIRNSQNQTRQFQYQVIDMERQATDLRRRVNDDIFNKQQQIQRDQISNDRLRKQIAIDTVDLQYRKTIANEDDRVAAVLSAEADLVKLRKTNAADIETARRTLETDIAKQQRDTQNYIYGLAREADSIRRSTLNYEVQIEDYRIATERKIYDLRLSVIRQEEDARTKAERGSPVWQGAGAGMAPTGKIVSIGGGHSLDASAAEAYGKMVADAAKQGVAISLKSSYRSNDEQDVLYKKYLKGTGNLAAPPGASGHNRGTSLDVKSGIEWMQRNGAKYGWHNTGMSFSQKEPWHFDYKSGSMQAGSAAPTAGGAANAASRWRGYLKRLSFLETDGISRPNEQGSGANGFFQFKPSTRKIAMAASGGKDPWSSNYNESAAATQAFIQKKYPYAAGAIGRGEYARADAVLRISEWPSLPGGTQAQPTAKQRKANQFLANESNTGIPSVDAATAIVESQTAALPRGPKVPGIPVSKIRGQNVALDAQGNKVKQEAIALQEKLGKLGEEGALQRVYEAAQGENILKQKNRELDLAKAEASSIDVMSADKQAIATFDARSLETTRQIEEDNRLILKYTSEMKELTVSEKQAIADAAQLYLTRQKAALAVDKQMLQVSQQMRFNSEMAAMRLELQTRGAGVNAGFFGAAAQAYNQELTTGTGNPANAAEKARLTRTNEVNNEIVSMRENLAMLKDPTYQVIEGARAIGSAFSDSFKGVVSGSMTAQESLAAFFQKTSDHFLEMASQMLTQQLILKLIGFGMNLFAPGANAIGGGAGANFQMPGQAFIPTGGYGFAKGGTFTNSIVSSPTLFKFANGGALRDGVMGEAGPEAIMPLTRGPGGRLGVDASGSEGGVNVTVNVDAKGSSVEGDDKRSSELGRVIAVAVQQELIKQKRSGGILTK
jgi:lambda family phage tail tape measure protein